MRGMPRGIYISDEAVVAGIKKDDGAALAYLYKLHFPMILHFIQQNNGTEEEAKDIFQEAVIIFYEKVKEGSLELNCQIKTYLYSVCRRLWLKKLTEKNRVGKPRDEEFFVELAAEEVVDEEKEIKFDLMAESLLLLGEPCRSLLEDFYIHEQSMQQISDKFGYTNPENAKNQKYKCLVRLKKLFFSVYKTQD
jgi:RNA polymerase sigma factor (sigma-70 family)